MVQYGAAFQTITSFRPAPHRSDFYRFPSSKSIWLQPPKVQRFCMMFKNASNGQILAAVKFQFLEAFI